MIAESEIDLKEMEVYQQQPPTNIMCYIIILTIRFYLRHKEDISIISNTITTNTTTATSSLSKSVRRRVSSIVFFYTDPHFNILLCNSMVYICMITYL